VNVTENAIQVERTLPEGWALVGFDDAVITASTTNKKVKQRDYQLAGALPVVDQGQEFIGGYTGEVDKQVDCELPVIVFGDHTRVFKFVNFGFAAGADGVKVLEPTKAFHPKLLFYFFLALDLPDRGYSRHFQFLRKEAIPVPPLPEQRRIVAEIETQFTRLDAGVAALERARANLRRYRAAVLKAACGGRLVPTEAELARAEGRAYEPAGQLLDRILAERRAKWEADYLEKQRSKGGEPKNDKWKQKYKQPASPTIEDLPELPEGWCWATVAQCVKIIDYRGRTPPYSEEGIPHLRSSNIRDGQVIWRDLRYVTEETYQRYMTRGLPEKGDLLFTTEAPLGEVAFAPEKRFSLAQRMMILRPEKGFLSPGFLKYQIMSAGFQQSIRYRETGSTVTGISSRNFRPAPLRVSPFPEQRRIVAEVERRLSVVEALEREVEAALARAGRLRQAVLKRAFEGRLVAQDPDDEPASALLERIRAAREARAAGGKKRKTRQMRLPEM
jgi:type I restriction enzyme S subunit